VDDEQFLVAFENGALSPAEFHHRDHLRLAWVQVKRLGLAGGADAVAAGSGGSPPPMALMVSTTRP
jgi:hypothetical protein